MVVVGPGTAGQARRRALWAAPDSEVLPAQQLRTPSSSQKKSLPFGAAAPLGAIPIRLFMNWLPFEVSVWCPGSLSPRIAAGTEISPTPQRQLS